MVQVFQGPGFFAFPATRGTFLLLGTIIAAMNNVTTLSKPSKRRRYQEGSLKDDGDRWAVRWRVDVPQPDGTMKRVRKWDVLSKKVFPTEELAQKQLEKIVSAANGKGLVLPPELRAVEVLLCDSCRERLIAALTTNRK
jgi:hypothetical protein